MHQRTRTVKVAALALIIAAVLAACGSEGSSTNTGSNGTTAGTSSTGSTPAGNSIASTFVLGGPPECPERPFCQLGLEDTYGIEFADFQSYDFGLIGQAVRQGEAAIGLVLSSDGSLAADS